MKKTFFLIIILTVFVLDISAQLKIGKNPTEINSNSLLELESDNKGMLLPRIQLIDDTSRNPLSAHIAGMMVYNISPSGVGIHRVVSGIYVNDGTKWVQSSGGSAPQLLIEKKLVPISNNGQTTLVLPTGFPSVDSDADFNLFRNGVLLLKDIDYNISTNNQIQIINNSFSLSTSDELYAILKSIKL